jgi:hypothetical protein
LISPPHGDLATPVGAVRLDDPIVKGGEFLKLTFLPVTM